MRWSRKAPPQEGVSGRSYAGQLAWDSVEEQTWHSGGRSWTEPSRAQLHLPARSMLSLLWSTFSQLLLLLGGKYLLPLSLCPSSSFSPAPALLPCQLCCFLTHLRVITCNSLSTNLFSCDFFFVVVPFSSGLRSWISSLGGQNKVKMERRKEGKRRECRLLQQHQTATQISPFQFITFWVDSHKIEINMRWNCLTLSRPTYSPPSYVKEQFIHAHFPITSHGFQS